MTRDGLTARLTKSGLPVLRVHYTADSNKDPCTPEGAKWFAEAVQGYAQGAQDPGWRKEMEIEYGAFGGVLLFPLWQWYVNTVKIAPFPIEQEAHVKFYGTYDHGHIHNAAYHVHAILPSGRKVTVWEFADTKVPIRAIAEIIKGNAVKLVHDGRSFAGNPYAGKEVVRICDPHLFERRGGLSDDPNVSIGDLFRDRYGVYFQKGHKGGQLACADTLTGDLWADPAHPKYQIFATCTQLLYELPRLRFKSITSVQARHRNAPEQLVDKDDDAWDSLCHFLRLFPSTVATKAAKSMVGTFAWHQKQLKTRRPLANSYSRV